MQTLRRLAWQCVTASIHFIARACCSPLLASALLCLPFLSQTAPHESEFRSLMGVFSTTGKVLIPYTVCSLMQPRIQAMFLFFRRAKLKLGSAQSKFSCAVSRRKQVFCAKFCCNMARFCQ